jgi:predicted nuclease with TOPRIM domain
MVDILTELNLQPEASEKDVKAKVQEIKNALAIKEQELVNRDTKIQELQAKLDVFEAKEKAEKEKSISDLIDGAFKNRQINAEGKAIWKSILEVDFDNGSKAIQALAKTEKLSEVINSDSESKPEVVLSPIQQMMVNPF